MRIYVDKKKCLLIYGIAAFVFNSFFRSSIANLFGIQLPGSLTSINVFAIACLAFIFYIGLYDDVQYHQYFMFIMIGLYTVIVYISNSFERVALSSSIGQRVLFLSILPALLLLIPSYDSVDFKDLLVHFLKFFDAVYVLVFLVGIMDYFLGGVVNNFIATYMSDAAWAAMIRVQNSYYGFRMCTVMGGPLMNAFYAMVMIVLTRILEEVYHEKVLNRYFVYLIGIVSIALTGSRAALLLIVAYVLVVELSGSLGLVRILPVILAFVVFFNTDVFQKTVGARFKLGFTSSSEARYKLFRAFMGNDFGRFHWFFGGGYNYSRWLTSSLLNPTMNFEYPFMMFTFDYGIVAALVYYLLIFVFPVAYMLARKQYRIAFGFSILFAFLQTFNGVAQFYDMNLEMAFLAVLLCGIADQARRGQA